MKLTARWQLDGQPDTVETTTRPVDVVRWEKASKKTISDGVGFEGMSMMIHMAAKRLGQTDLPYQSWLDRLAEFDVQKPDEDPSQPHEGL